MEKLSNSKRGGKRSNSGRPSTFKKKAEFNIRLEKEDKEFLKREFPGYGSISRAFREFISYLKKTLDKSK